MCFFSLTQGAHENTLFSSANADAAGRPGAGNTRPALTPSRSGSSMPTAKLVPSTTDPAAKFARREKLRLIMRQAWSWARHGAAKFGGNARQYIAEAIRIVWAEKRKLAREIAE